MRYLKYFESYNKNFMESIKKGDYVIINAPDVNVHNEIMIITALPEKNIDGFTVHAKTLDDKTHETFYDHEIVKKLTPREAEFIMNIKKYNV